MKKKVYISLKSNQIKPKKQDKIILNNKINHYLSLKCQIKSISSISNHLHD